LPLVYLTVPPVVAWFPEVVVNPSQDPLVDVAEELDPFEAEGALRCLRAGGRQFEVCLDAPWVW
jgi:hypothetical protein